MRRWFSGGSLNWLRNFASRGIPSGGGQVLDVRQIRSFGAAMAFDGGRMRDTVFVGMPRAADPANLNRASLSIASKDTFFYATSLVDLRKEMEPGTHTRRLVGWGSPENHRVALGEWNHSRGMEKRVRIGGGLDRELGSEFAMAINRSGNRRERFREGNPDRDDDHGFEER